MSDIKFGNAGLEVFVKGMGGEERIRLGDYTLTTATSGGWQNAHFHKGLSELYVVKCGFVITAHCNKGSDNRSVNFYFPNDHFAFHPLVEHAIFMSRGASIHTIKTGEPIGNPDKKNNDWYQAAELNIFIKPLTLLNCIRFGRPRLGLVDRIMEG